jgi:hypothetical protein
MTADMNFRRQHLLHWLIALPLAFPAAAQIVTHGEHIDLTLEGYANTTAGYSQSVTPDDPTNSEDLRIDAALRGLARWKNPSGPDVGLRAVIERTTCPQRGSTFPRAPAGESPAAA